MTKLEVRVGKLENAVGRKPPSLEEAWARFFSPDLSEIERARASRDVVGALSHEERKELVAWLDEILPDVITFASEGN